MILPRAKPRPILLEAVPVLLLLFVGGSVVAYLGYKWLSGAAGIVALFVFWFFRNPERKIPAEQKVVVSPADGKVVEVEKVYEDRYLHDEAIKVGIFMSPVDVHVNRIPYGGKIVAIQHRRGKFLSAFKPNAPLENEQNAVLLEAPSGKRILFVQIAGLLARRIVYWIHEGQQVAKGERFGMIKFGSRLDLYLPTSTRIEVKPSEKVKGGATRIGVME